MGVRERAQAYLELASKATEGPWDYDRGGDDCPAMVYQVSDEIYPDEIAKELLEVDAQFIAASRTEGVWAAQKLLEALDVLEKYMTCDDCNSKGYTLQRVKEKRGWRTIEDVVKITCKRCGIARQFLERSEQ
jgi:hypothetical protein